MAPSHILLPVILLAFGPIVGSVDAQADSSEELPTPRGRHPLPPPPSAVAGDREDPRAAYDALGRDEASADEDWMAPWGRRKRRGKASDGVLDPSLSTVASVVAPRNSCRDLRSKRYISDGFCTSSRPLTEAVCADKCCSTPSPGHRGPVRNKHRPNPPAPQSNYRLQPWYADYVKVWARGQNEMNSVIAGEVGGDGAVASRGGAATPGGTRGAEEDRVEWRCVEDAVRRRRVRLLCRDGSRRTYQVRLVKSCKCVQRRRVAEKGRRRGRRRGRRKMARGGGGRRRAKWAVD